MPTLHLCAQDGVWHFRDPAPTIIPEIQANSIHPAACPAQDQTRGGNETLMQKTKKYPISQTDEIGRRKRKMGQVIVIEDRCKGCGFCIANCPRQVLSLSSVFNKKGYHPPEVADTTRCVNCHFCEILCPEFAIYSMEYDDFEE